MSNMLSYPPISLNVASRTFFLDPKPPKSLLKMPIGP